MFWAADHVQVPCFDDEEPSHRLQPVSTYTNYLLPPSRWFWPAFSTSTNAPCHYNLAMSMLLQHININSTFGESYLRTGPSDAGQNLNYWNPCRSMSYWSTSQRHACPRSPFCLSVNWCQIACRLYGLTTLQVNRYQINLCIISLNASIRRTFISCLILKMGGSTRPWCVDYFFVSCSSPHFRP